MVELGIRARGRGLQAFIALIGAMVATTASAQATGDPGHGAVVFQRCSMCHSVDPKAKPGIGPNLAGVVGRRAGSTAYRYSLAMKAAGFVWTPERLAAYLAKPSDVVKGTKMPFAGLPNPQDRADVVRYLATKK